MGVRFPSVQSNTSFALPASAVETVIVTTPPLNISLDFGVVYLLWFLAIQAGTGVVQLSLRIRRGTTVAGPVVNTTFSTHTLAAANFANLSGAYFDTPGAVAGQQYSLTCVQTGATAASVIADIAMIAFAL